MSDGGGATTSAGGMTSQSLDRYQDELARRERSLERREERVSAREQAYAEAALDRRDAEAGREQASSLEAALRASERELTNVRAQATEALEHVRDLERRVGVARKLPSNIEREAAALAGKAHVDVDRRHLEIVLAGLILLHGTEYTRRSVENATSLAQLVSPGVGNPPKLDSRVVGPPNKQYRGLKRGIPRL